MLQIEAALNSESWERERFIFHVIYLHAQLNVYFIVNTKRV